MTPPEEIEEKETAAAEEAASPEKAEKPKAKKLKKVRKIRRRMLERTADNDIRYRGPFSYRHFRIFAWFFIVLAQIALLMRIGLKLDPASAAVIFSAA